MVQLKQSAQHSQRRIHWRIILILIINNIVHYSLNILLFRCNLIEVFNFEHILDDHRSVEIIFVGVAAAESLNKVLDHLLLLLDDQKGDVALQVQVLHIQKLG